MAYPLNQNSEKTSDVKSEALVLKLLILFQILTDQQKCAICLIIVWVWPLHFWVFWEKWFYVWPQQNNALVVLVSRDKQISCWGKQNFNSCPCSGPAFTDWLSPFIYRMIPLYCEDWEKWMNKIKENNNLIIIIIINNNK